MNNPDSVKANVFEKTRLLLFPRPPLRVPISQITFGQILPQDPTPFEVKMSYFGGSGKNHDMLCITGQGVHLESHSKRPKTFQTRHARAREACGRGKILFSKTVEWSGGRSEAEAEAERDGFA